MIEVGAKVIVDKGCKARGVQKGATAQVQKVEVLGKEFGYTVQVVLHFLNTMLSGKVLTFYARHQNRLGDELVSLNDGQPDHRIVVRVKKKTIPQTTQE